MKGACDNDCGNGLIESSEECDDGNLILGDGCDFCKASCAAGCLNCEMEDAFSASRGIV